jgi:hypothetical protein
LLPDAACPKKGDVIDLWATLHHKSLREAALTCYAPAISNRLREQRRGEVKERFAA